MSLSNPQTVNVLKALIQELKNEDVTVVKIMPPQDSSWEKNPPLIPKQFIEEIRKNGSILERQIKEKENTI